MTLNEVGGSLPTSVSGHITSFPLFVSQLSIMLQKTDFFFFSPMVVMIVLNKFLPLVVSWLTTGGQLKNVQEAASSLPTAVNSGSKRLRSDQVPVKDVDCRAGSQAEEW